MMDATLRAELASMEPGSIIELFEIETNCRIHGVDQTFRFSNTYSASSTVIPVIWAGNSYWPITIEADGFAYDGKGVLPTPTLRLGNVNGEISAILNEVNAFTPGNDLGLAKFTRIRTLARFLDAANFDDGVNPYGTPNPTATFPPEIYYFDKKELECRDVVEFKMESAFSLVGERGPRRQCLKHCTFVLGGDGCGYNGPNFFDENNNPVASAELSVCSQTLTGCRLRHGEGAELPYGGYPGIGNYNA